MTYFVVADVHGFYDLMISALQNEGFDISNPNHIFVSLGDLFDRGPQSAECLSFVMSLPQERRILIRGNHEDLLEECFIKQRFGTRDHQNGTFDTVNQFMSVIEGAPSNIWWEILPQWELLRSYLDSCLDYYEIGNRVFVHGWIPMNPKNFGAYYTPNVQWRTGDWKAARWLNGMQMNHDWGSPEGKTIYCGHWHTSWARSYLEGISPAFDLYDKNTGELIMAADYHTWYGNGIVALDACTVISGFVNCERIEIND